MRVTLDTNVLISALLYGGRPAQIIQLVHDGKVELFVSLFILQELERTLERKFGFSRLKIEELRFSLEAAAKMVHPRERLTVVKRKDSDNRILECAAESHSHVLITGNMKDLRPLGSFQDVLILTPREFMDKFASKLGLA